MPHLRSCVSSSSIVIVPLKSLSMLRNARRIVVEKSANLLRKLLSTNLTSDEPHTFASPLSSRLVKPSASYRWKRWPPSCSSAPMTKSSSRKKSPVAGVRRRRRDMNLPPMTPVLRWGGSYTVMVSSSMNQVTMNSRVASMREMPPRTARASASSWEIAPLVGSDASAAAAEDAAAAAGAAPAPDASGGATLALNLSAMPSNFVERDMSRRG
mmetsp:Transcript_15733/g.59668  ORF Transcript_15733/g.59668 Transcript_15733/m.59668 type:complete len:212 (+) Transcript_15733:593-1228(+)